MCYPMSAGSAALMGAGLVSNMMGANSQASARAGVMNNALAEQQKYQQQATDKFNATLPLASREAADKNAGDAAGVRLGRDQALMSSMGAAAPVSGASGPADVGALFDSSMRDSAARGGIQANANAKVGGIADASQKLGIDLQKAGEWQKIFSNNITHSAALVPGELENANYAGSTARGLGGILSAGGQALGTAKLAGANAGGLGSSWGSLFSTGAPISDTVAGPTQPGVFANIFK